MRVVRRQRAEAASNDPGKWWRTYKKDSSNREVLWDAWDEQPRLQLVRSDRFAADVEAANWQKQARNFG